MSGRRAGRAHRKASRRHRRGVALCLFLAASLAGFAAPAGAGGQEPGLDTGGAQALRVFLDCNRCDFDYLRTEITFVNYVRDRDDAQVHVLVTREQTGGGGEAYTMDFVGLEAFAGRDDQLRFFTSDDATDDDVRRDIAQRLRLGLVRYAAATPLASEITIGREVDDDRTQLNARSEDDPWNFWFFRTRVRTQLSGEERERSTEVSGSFSANRTTDQWKINLGVNAEYEEDRFELSDARVVTSTSRDNAVTGRVVKSLGEHAGFGFGGSAVSSSFRNLDLALRFAPAIEYNFYPYSESTRRQFTVRYAVGLDRFSYEEPTLLDKTTETRPSHAAVVSMELNEPWGDSELTFEFSQFLDDASSRRLVLFGETEIRLFRGFTLDIEGDVSAIRDQIFLPRRGSTDEEILLRRRQLATDYEYELSIGITYTFGSIFNNIVNSRFAGSSGGFIRSF